MTLEFAMNIELDEVVVQDVSDDVLELAACGAQGGPTLRLPPRDYFPGSNC